MSRRITQLITPIICSCLLFAAGSYDVLNLPQDARSLALNNSISAYDTPLMQNNPASMSMHSNVMSYSYLYLPANIHMGELHHISKKSKWVKAANISLLNYGTIIDSETEEKSHAFEFLVKRGYKRELKNIVSIGISGGYLFSSITGFNSQLLFSNVGVRSRLFRKKIGIGISLENIGMHLKSYTDVKEPIPTFFRTAIYYKLIYIPLIINSEIVRYFNNNIYYCSSGLEFISKRRLSFRIGFSSKKRDYIINNFTSDIIAGISGGVGFQFKNVILDVGFMNMGSAGCIMGFSITKKRKQL